MPDKNFRKDMLLGWDLPCAAFQAIDFGFDGTPYVLTGELGLFKLDGKRWIRLTPQWSKYEYVSSLVIVGNKAVIGTHDAGVLVFDLS